MAIYDFNAPNGSPLPAGLTAREGTFEIQNNSLVCTALGPIVGIATENNAADGSVISVVNLEGLAANRNGSSFRYKDPDNYWTATINGTGLVELRLRLAGSNSAHGTYQIPSFDVNTNYSIETTFTGSSIAVSIDGTQRITTTNTSLQTETAHGTRFGNTTASIDILVVLGTDSININNPRFTYTLENDEITVPIIGSYNGSPVALRRRVIYDDDSSVVPNFDWAVFDSNPTGGAFNDSVVLPGSERAYRIEVDFSNDALINDQSTVFYGSYVLGGEGQSLCELLSIDGTDVTPNANTREFDLASGNYNTPTGNGTRALLNYINSVTNRMVVFYNNALSGQALLAANANPSNPTKFMWNPSNPLSVQKYVDFINASTALGGFSAVLCMRGETDGQYFTSGEATFKTEFAAFIADIRTRTGNPNLPFIISPVGFTAGTNPVDEDLWQQVKRAQFQVIDEDILNHAAYHYDLAKKDNIHNTAAENIVFGQRAGRTFVKDILGLPVEAGYPKIALVQVVSPTQTRVVLTPSDGTDFTPAIGATALNLSEDGGNTYNVAITSFSKESATVFLITHAPAAVNYYRYAYGKGSEGGWNPNNPNTIIQDNSSTTNPLDYSKLEGTVLPAPPTGNASQIRGLGIQLAINL